MTAKIYIRRQALLVGDNLEEINKLSAQCIEVIEKNEGAVEEVGVVEPIVGGPNNGHFIQVIDYAVFRKNFDTEEF